MDRAGMIFVGHGKDSLMWRLVSVPFVFMLLTLGAPVMSVSCTDVAILTGAERVQCPLRLCSIDPKSYLLEPFNSAGDIVQNERHQLRCVQTGQACLYLCQNHLCNEGKVKLAGFLQWHPVQMAQFVGGV